MGSKTGKITSTGGLMSNFNGGREMTKQQRKKIEREFYGYTRNRQKAADYVSSHVYDHFGVDYSSERVKSSHGNGTESSVIRMIDEADEAWRWCLVFEKTLERFRWEKKDELMRKKYIERKNPYMICGEIGIGRSTYFYWKEEILQIAFLWATDLKLF